MVSNYKELDVWNLAMQLVEEVYNITDGFPKKEQYRLTDQLCRAVVSVPSNIAEGSKRHTTKEFLRFLGIAQGSLAEVETQVIIAFRLHYITQMVLDNLLQIAQVLGKKMHALSNALERKVAV